MPAITIHVDDEVYRRLQVRAEASQTSVESLAEQTVAERMRQDVPDAEFRETVTRLIDQYRPVLKRLAE